MLKQLICEAIAKKRLLQFRYRDLVRVVEPHLLGRDTADNDALSAYLVRGYTKTSRKPYWRLYLLSDMHVVSLLDECFPGPRKGYNPRDKHMTKIYCRL